MGFPSRSRPEIEGKPDGRTSTRKLCGYGRFLCYLFITLQYDIMKGTKRVVACHTGSSNLADTGDLDQKGRIDNEIFMVWKDREKDRAFPFRRPAKPAPSDDQ